MPASDGRHHHITHRAYALAALLRAASSSAIDAEMIIKSAANGIRYASAPMLPTDRTTASPIPVNATYGARTLCTWAQSSTEPRGHYRSCRHQAPCAVPQALSGDVPGR